MMGRTMRQPGHGSNRVRNPPEIIHVDQGRLNVSQQLSQTTYSRVPALNSEETFLQGGRLTG